MNNKLSALEETIKATYNPDAFASQLDKGLEHAVEGSKISMKLIAQQNDLFLNAMTKALSGSLLPNPFGFALGGQAMEDYLAVQKDMMAKAMQQGTAVIEAMQEAGKKATAEFTSMVHQSLANAQKDVVEVNASSKSGSKP